MKETVNIRHLLRKALKGTVTSGQVLQALIAAEAPKVITGMQVAAPGQTAADYPNLLTRYAGPRKVVPITGMVIF